jgi:hypothetical protein
MNSNELVRLLGQALSAADDKGVFRSVLWHGATANAPAHLDVEVRDGNTFIVTVNEVK